MDHDLDLLIRGGLVVTGAGIDRVDVGVRGERIVEMAPAVAAARSRRVVDATGKMVLPGMIDVHTHPVYLDDLGGTAVTAAFGGVTTLIHYAYAKPGASLLKTLAQYRQDGERLSVLDFGLHGGLFDVAQQLAEVPAAFRLGVTSFKVFMTYAKLKWMTDDYWLTALLDVVAAERGLVAVHAENGLATDYLEDKCLAAGRSPVEAFTAMRPDVLEAEALNRAMSLAHVMGCPLYVPHVSAAACLEPLRRARLWGWRVFGETCPQYLTLTDATTQKLGALAKIGPPLRTPEDNEALWGGLADGTLVTIASDHAPKAKKATDDFFAAAYGSPQIETMLPVVHQAGVNGGRITWPALVRAMSETPARLFGLYPRKGILAPGSDADIVIFDPDRRQALTGPGQHSCAGYTLYEGRDVTGMPVMSIQRGAMIVADGELLARPGRACFLPTDTSSTYN